MDMPKTKKLMTVELMSAEYHYGFFNGMYKGEPTDYILLELPHKEPNGSWVAKAVPIADSEMPVAIGEPEVIELPGSEW